MVEWEMDQEEAKRSPWLDALLWLPLLTVCIVAGWASVAPAGQRAPVVVTYPIKLSFAGLPFMHPTSPALAVPALALNSATQGKKIDEAAQPGTPTGRLPAPTVDAGKVVSGTVALAATIDPSRDRQQGNAAFLVSDFNLAGGADSSDAIEVHKPVLVNGRSAGSVLIRIGSASQVFVRRGDIAGLLGTKLARLRGNDEFVTLDQIRDAGVDVRYSSTKDTLVITT